MVRPGKDMLFGTENPNPLCFEERREDIAKGSARGMCRREWQVSHPGIRLSSGPGVYVTLCPKTMLCSAWLCSWMLARGDTPSAQN